MRRLFMACLFLVACREAAAERRVEVAVVASSAAEAGAVPDSSARAIGAAASTASTPASAAAPEPERAATPDDIELVAVPDDVRAYLVRGRRGTATHTVFMPGLCSNAYGYLYAFPEAAHAHGGVVAIDGDEPCGAPNSGFRSFSWRPGVQKKRIEAALAAAGVAVPADGITLVGYSSGASIAELMHLASPELFPRLVLIAPPVDPLPFRLKTARAVAAMACSLDVTSRMQLAVRNLAPFRVPARYFEMPGCTHGNIADGERVFDAAFSWLETVAPPSAQ